MFYSLLLFSLQLFLLAPSIYRFARIIYRKHRQLRLDDFKRMEGHILSQIACSIIEIVKTLVH